MKVPTNIQILKGVDGKPAFAVIPYSDYMRLSTRREPTVPNDVIGKVVNHDMTPVRAWREYLGLTQAVVAQRLGISQSAYAQQESKENLRKSSREKIANALGIESGQLAI